MRIVIIAMLFSVSVFAAEKKLIQPLPVVKTKPAGKIRVQECQPAPPHNGRPALWCKKLDDKETK